MDNSEERKFQSQTTYFIKLKQCANNFILNSKWQHENKGPRNKNEHKQKHIHLGTALFWVITQRVMGISYQRLGPIFSGSRTQQKSIGLTPEYGADMVSRNVGKKLPLLAA
jgi:hypothetical protein